MTKKDFKLICESIALAPVDSLDVRLVMLQYVADRLNLTYHKFNKQKFMNYGLELLEKTRWGSDREPKTKVGLNTAKSGTAKN